MDAPPKVDLDFTEFWYGDTPSLDLPGDSAELNEDNNRSRASSISTSSSSFSIDQIPTKPVKISPSGDTQSRSRESFPSDLGEREGKGGRPGSVDTCNSLDGPKSPTDNGPAKLEMRHGYPVGANCSPSSDLLRALSGKLSGLRAVLAEHPFSSRIYFGPAETRESTVNEPQSDPATSSTHEQQGHTPSEEDAGRTLLSLKSGLVKDKSTDTQLSLTEQEDQLEQINIPRWKMKMAQKNKRPKDVEQAEQTYRPMNQEEYVEFCSGVNLSRTNDSAMSEGEVQDISIPGDDESETTEAKSIQVDNTHEKKPAPQMSEVESVVLPQTTARVDTSEKCVENAQDNNSETNNIVSMNPPRLETIQVDETVHRSKNTEGDSWEELVATAVGKLQMENEAPAAETATKEDAQMGNKTSRGNDAQAANHIKAPLPDSSRQDGKGPSDENNKTALENAESKTETNSSVDTNPIALNHLKEMDVGLNAEDEEEAKRVAEAKANKVKEKNAKKKERRRRIAAAEWEKKAKAEQLKRELKETRRREQQEAKERKAKKARETGEGKQASTSKQTKDGGEGETEQSPDDYDIRDGAQEIPDVTQRGDTTIENISDFVETEEVDHLLRTKEWIENNGEPEQMAQIELDVGTTSRGVDSQETELPDEKESGGKYDDQKEDGEELKQAESHRVTSSPEAQPLPSEHQEQRHYVIQGPPWNPNLLVETWEQVDRMFGRIIPPADEAGPSQSGEVAGTAGNMGPGSDLGDLPASELALSASSSRSTSFLSDTSEMRRILAELRDGDEPVLDDHPVPMEDPQSSSHPTTSEASYVLQPEPEP